MMRVAALQYFFEAERLRRGWSMSEAAARCRISLSKAYQIRNGEDNVELETFEQIASAFGMAPADLAIAIGKGGPEFDREEATIIALIRQLPKEQRPFIAKALRGLLEPVASPPANRLRDVAATSPRRRIRDLIDVPTNGVNPDLEGRLPSGSRSVTALLSALFPPIQRLIVTPAI